MTGRIVWLASYPKSGNTWVRAILTALRTHPSLLELDALVSGGQPHSVAGSLELLGLDARWLTAAENDAVRTAMVRRIGGSDVRDPARALFRKTHERFRTGPSGREPFPADATRAAVLVVRDPRDVVCSFAPFFGLSLDEAIDRLATGLPGSRPSPAHALTAQPWGSWREHTTSWLAEDLPFAVRVLRYEDLLTDPVAALAPVLAALGDEQPADALRAAVEQVSFDRLRGREDASGFRERGRHAETFFRRGRAGSWREELSAAQAEAVEAVHGDVMVRLGYPVGDEARR